MSSATDLVVGLIEIANRDHQVAFAITLKASSRHDVEDSICAVAIVCVVTAALHLQIVNVLGVDLRSQIVGDVGVRDGDTINQPLDLVTASHMKHVMGHVRGGHVVGDHLHAVGAVGARSLLNVHAVQHGRWRDCLGGCLDGTF